MPNTGNETAKKEQTARRTMRIIWSILMVVFVVVILLRLHAWSQGTGGLHQILSPLGMVFLGVANLIGAGNKNLQRVLIAIALVLVVAGLITLIIY